MVTSPARVAPRRLRTARLLRVTLVILVGLFATSLLGPRPSGQALGAVSLVLYVLTSLVAAVACFVPADTHRTAAWGWRLVGVRALLIVAAAAIVTVHRLSMSGTDYPAVADWIVAVGYLVMYAGLMLLVTARSPRSDPGTWLDGLIVGLGLAALADALLLAPLEAAGSTLPTAPGMLLGQPIADVALVASFVGGVASRGVVPSRGLRLLVAAVGVRFVGDGLRVLMELRGTTSLEPLVALVWLTSAAIAGIAAGVPEDATHPRPLPGPSARWRGLALPGGASITSLGVLAVAQQHPVPPTATLLAIVVLSLSLARAGLTFRDVLSLSDEHRQARTDELTGLPNRRVLYERADALLAPAPDAGRRHRDPGDVPHGTAAVDAVVPTSLIIADLDRFKEINDSLGHPTGDALLVEVGHRLRALVPDDGLLARLGGDEFAILLPATDSSAAVEVARVLQEALTDPFSVDSVRLHVDASFGVATAVPGSAARQELLRCADMAMYDAKRSDVVVAAYADADHGDERDRLRMLEELRGVLADGSGAAGRLVVFLQPQLTMSPGAPRDRRVRGMEALVRWEHPRLGLVPPLDFLPLAVGAGLMSRVGTVVGGLSLDACRRWWDLGYELPVSVNMSGPDMHDDALPARVRAALESRGLPTSALVIEVTEHNVMSDPDRVRPVLDRLRADGVTISIDDYGTGFSSLAYLRQLPIDELKLDRLFVSDVVDDPTCTSIVRHIVDLAHSLGMRLVAEGIEDERTFVVLADLGCDVGQGYHLARPMPVSATLDWLVQTQVDTCRPTADQHAEEVGSAREEGPPR